MWYEWNITVCDIFEETKTEYKGIVKANSFQKAVEKILNDYEYGNFAVDKITVKNVFCNGNTLEYSDASLDFDNLFIKY